MEKRKVDLVEEARQLRLQAEALEKKVQLARGTRDLPRVAVAPKHGPFWVGDNGPTDELMTVVERLLRTRPLLLTEILEATGARDNRVKGVLMRMQRYGVRLIDVAPEGTGKALWFIPSDAVYERLMRVKKRATDRR